MKDRFKHNDIREFRTLGLAKKELIEQFCNKCLEYPKQNNSLNGSKHDLKIQKRVIILRPRQLSEIYKFITRETCS